MSKFAITKEGTETLDLAGGLLKFGSTFLGARQFAAAGRSAQAIAESEAGQFDIIAGQQVPVAQRKAEDIRRTKRLLQSRLRARAAASGTGGPGIETLEAELEGEGEYRALLALFEGEERAANIRFGAKVRRFAGERARIAGTLRARAARTAAFGTLLAGFGKNATLAEKYGPDLPPPGFDPLARRLA